jgi:hypothetical protein
MSTPRRLRAKVIRLFCLLAGIVIIVIGVVGRSPWADHMSWWRRGSCIILGILLCVRPVDLLRARTPEEPAGFDDLSKRPD